MRTAPPPLAVVAEVSEPIRIRPRSFHPRDLATVVGSAAASLALTWLAYSQILPFQGLPGFLVMWASFDFLIYYVAVRETQGPVVARDRTMAAIVSVVAIAIVIPSS